MHRDKKVLFLFFMMAIVMAACSPSHRYQVLSFLFDGVPAPEAAVKPIPPSTDTLITKIPVKQEVRKEIFVHPPFQEKKCASCHQQTASNSLVQALPSLCYTCHEDFNNKYKTVHGPVASGYCLECHSPHTSKNAALLARTGQNICYNCHNQKQVMKNKVHEKIGNGNCTICHSPHGGENRAMLKDGTCYYCHDDFNAKYKTLHGPVASGYCNACHGMHEIKTPKLLTREGTQVCLFCHNQKQVMNSPSHKNGKSNCLECHNPHGGDDRFMLTKK